MWDEREPDGNVHYRRDGFGARVATLPATCKVGVHSLRKAGFEAIESGGVLYLSCAGCGWAPDVDHFWALRTRQPKPERFELDDTPYLTVSPLVPNMIEPRASMWLTM